MLLLLAPKRVGGGDGEIPLQNKWRVPPWEEEKAELMPHYGYNNLKPFSLFANVDLSFHGVEGQMAIYTTQRTKN